MSALFLRPIYGLTPMQRLSFPIACWDASPTIHDQEYERVWRRACIAHRGAGRHELSFGTVRGVIFDTKPLFHYVPGHVLGYGEEASVSGGWDPGNPDTLI